MILSTRGSEDKGPKKKGMTMKWMQAESVTSSRARVVDADGRTGLVAVNWNSGHCSFYGPVFTLAPSAEEFPEREDKVILDAAPEFVVRV